MTMVVLHVPCNFSKLDVFEQERTVFNKWAILLHMKQLLPEALDKDGSIL